MKMWKVKVVGFYRNFFLVSCFDLERETNEYQSWFERNLENFNDLKIFRELMEAENRRVKQNLWLVLNEMRQRVLKWIFGILFDILSPLFELKLR